MFLSDTVSPLMFLQGEAVSAFAKDPADNSTNYCSLHNLMDGNDFI